MREERRTYDERDPWASRSTIHLAPILDDTRFDPEKATLMFLPTPNMIARYGRRREGMKKRVLLLIAMLLILALELSRAG